MTSRNRLLRGGGRRRLLLTLALLTGLVPTALAGERMAPSGATITGDVLSAGGGVSSDGAHSLTSVVGQSAVGTSQNGGAAWYHGVLAPGAGATVGEGEGEGEGEGLSASILGDNPVDLVVGQDYTFALSVSGETGALSYQWQFDPGSKVLSILPGENGPTYTLMDAMPEMAGSYACEVSDDLSTVLTPPVDVIIVSQVPLSGAATLLLMAALAALGACFGIRRSRPVARG